MLPNVKPSVEICLILWSTISETPPSLFLDYKLPRFRGIVSVLHSICITYRYRLFYILGSRGYKTWISLKKHIMSKKNFCLPKNNTFRQTYMKAYVYFFSRVFKLRNNDPLIMRNSYPFNFHILIFRHKKKKNWRA